MRRSVVLLSGGLDSTVTAYIARKDIGKRGELYAMTFDYGQRHRKEIRLAAKTAEALNCVDWVLVPLVLGGISSSALTGDSEVPTEETEGIPTTWVPQRNSIFLAYAFAYAESVDADNIYTGFNVVDYSGYPDCRPEFVRAMDRALNLASARHVTEGRGFAIETPIMGSKKVDIIGQGIQLLVPFENTWSCYKGERLACGVCDSCRIRLKAFEEVGMKDPLEYEDDN